MITDSFLVDIFELMLDDPPYERFKCQLEQLDVDDVDYTGIGTFINFKKSSDFPIDYIGENGSEQIVLEGVNIYNAELNIEAYVLLYITKGIINQLEIFNSNGEDFPQSYPTKYIMIQTWKNSNCKTIEK